jgi:hypothetical protein
VTFSSAVDAKPELEIRIVDGALVDPARFAGQIRALPDDLLRMFVGVPDLADRIPTIVPAVTAARDATADPDVRQQLQRFLDALA